MVELTMARIQEVTVILYAISLVFYFIDYLKKDPIAQRFAFWILSIVYITQTAMLIANIVEMKRLPVLSLFDGIYFYVWLLITVSFLLQLFYKVNFVIFFINVIGFIFMTIHTFAGIKTSHSPVGEALVSELLFIHITFAILSYTAFAMSFVFAILYLLVYKVLKKKKWTKQFGRLPSLHQARIGMLSALLTGIPILLISLILGTQWAYVVLDSIQIFDVKIIGSFCILLIYSGIVYMERKGKLQSNDFAWANVIAFLFVIVNFFLGSRLSEFHFWV